MNLIEKIVKKVSNAIDEIKLKALLNAYIKKQIGATEQCLTENKIILEGCIKEGNFENAYYYYDRIQENESKIVRLNEFKQFLLRNEDNEN